MMRAKRDTKDAARRVGRRSLRRRPRGSLFVAVVLLSIVLVLVVVVPLLPGYDPYSQDLSAALASPMTSSDGHLFILGSDTLGRDVLDRLALAGRISVLIMVIAVSISLSIGVVLGITAGYIGGWVDNAVMGLADLQLSVPRVVLLIAVVATVGPSIRNLTLVLGVTSWTSFARVARAMTLSLRSREYVLASVTQGASSFWIMRRHLFPNVLSQMLILGSFEFGQVLVLESSLSFLGLGVQPPLPSWGLMISEGQDYLQTDPWLAILPGFAVFMLIAGVQVVSQLFTAEAERDFDIGSVASRKEE